jgi:hypothetical protein
MLKVGLTAAITAAACFAVTATTGVARQEAPYQFVTVAPDSRIMIPSLDLGCRVWAQGADIATPADPGPLMVCGQESTGILKGVTVQMSLSHMRLSDGKKDVYTATRSP